MHLSPFCQCLQCNSILFDKNPADDAPSYNSAIFPAPLEMASIVEDERFGFYWGCPNCQTDAYLLDNIPPTMVPLQEGCCYAVLDAELYHIYRTKDDRLLAGPFRSYDEIEEHLNEKNLLLTYVTGLDHE